MYWGHCETRRATRARKIAANSLGVIMSKRKRTTGGGGGCVDGGFTGGVARSTVLAEVVFGNENTVSWGNSRGIDEEPYSSLKVLSLRAERTIFYSETNGFTGRESRGKRGTYDDYVKRNLLVTDQVVTRYVTHKLCKKAMSSAISPAPSPTPPPLPPRADRRRKLPLPPTKPASPPPNPTSPIVQAAQDVEHARRLLETPTINDELDDADKEIHRMVREKEVTQLLLRMTDWVEELVR